MIAMACLTSKPPRTQSASTPIPVARHGRNMNCSSALALPWRWGQGTSSQHCWRPHLPGDCSWRKRAPAWWYSCNQLQSHSQSSVVSVEICWNGWMQTLFMEQTFLEDAKSRRVVCQRTGAKVLHAWQTREMYGNARNTSNISELFTFDPLNYPLSIHSSIHYSNYDLLWQHGVEWMDQWMDQ